MTPYSLTSHFKFAKCVKGQGLVEYTLILVLVSLAVNTALTNLGASINVALGKARAALDGEEIANTPPICETGGAVARAGGNCGSGSQPSHGHHAPAPGGGGNSPPIIPPSTGS